MSLSLPLGNVMLDVVGTELTAEDARRLEHPQVGGVILFARNYRDPSQLRALTAAIRALRNPQLLIAVDHEGGRVQRFRSGFCAIPPMRRLGEEWDRDPAAALRSAQHVGAVIALELIAHGIDFSFTPVLDLDYGNSGVIGNRAFHRNPEAVSALAGALIDGLHGQGMIAVGKHFPGHGYCAADSHLAVPTDERIFEQIEAADLRPFKDLLATRLDAVMPAHVIYSKVDGKTAGFSRLWLWSLLRQRYGFKGVIFSDDLSMEGASVVGGPVERARAAFAAGCDVALLCNQPAAADALLAGLADRAIAPDWGARWEALRARSPLSAPEQLGTYPDYRVALESVQSLG